LRRGNGLKPARPSCWKKGALAKKSGRRPFACSREKNDEPFDERTILSGEGIEARKKLRKGPSLRQTSPFHPRKSQTSFPRRGFSTTAIPAKRGTPTELILDDGSVIETFNILDLETAGALLHFVVLCHRRGGLFSPSSRDAAFLNYIYTVVPVLAASRHLNRQEYRTRETSRSRN